MRHRSIKSRAGKVMLGAVLAGALSGAGASIARATLSIDLEAGSGTPVSPDTTASVSPGGQVVLNVYAVVTDPDNAGTADGLGGLFASFDATGSGISSSTSGLSVLLNPPGTFDYNQGTAASTGVGYTYTDSSGAVHDGVGNYSGAATGGPTTPTFDSTTPNNWVFAAYLNNNGTTVGSIYNGGTALAGNAGAYFDIGTLTLNTSATAANGSTVAVTGYGRTQLAGSPFVAALWTENGFVQTPATGTFNLTSDDSVTVTVGTVGPPPPTHNPGDVNDDGIVNNTDLNIVIQHWNQNASDLTWEDGNLVGDPTIDNSDLNAVIQNWNKTYSDYNPSIIVAPEPASFGLLAGVALLLGKRRRQL